MPDFSLPGGRTSRSVLSPVAVVVAIAAVLAVVVVTVLTGSSGSVAVRQAAAAAPTANGVYTLASGVSGKCVEVRNSVKTNGAPVTQAACATGAARQQWRAAKAGSGLRLHNVNSGLCLDVKDGLATNGLQLRQWTCNTTTAQQWKFTESSAAPGKYRISSLAHGKCAGVKDGSTAGNQPIVQETCSDVARMQWRLTQIGATPAPTTTPTSTPKPPAGGFESAPVGFARQNGGTTGGAGGKTVTVTSASQFVRYATTAGRYVIRVNGTISLSGMQKVAADKTIIGVGTVGRITGGGLNVSSVRNVVLRNLTFTGSKDDAINVEASKNVWIDHNDLSRGYDGLIDIKRGSDFVTVSWNRLHHHNKAALLGHADTNGAQDRGHLRVTYVHNWFEGTTQRHPRVRFGNPVHVLNNYYSGIGSYAIASTLNAGVLVERNYFENTRTPTAASAGTSPAGNIKLVGNHLVKSGTPVSRNPSLVAAIPYSYTADSAANVKSIVTKGAGVGRI